MSAHTIHIPSFRGLDQYGDGANVDPRCAADCVNALTRQGVLQPMTQCRLLSGTLPGPIETLARLHRRWHTQDHDVLIAASGGQLYWMLPGGRYWKRMGMPWGWTQKSYQSNVWSCVAYEINPPDASAPVDVLLMSNAQDGMICVRGDTMAVSPVATPRKFGVIARHAERIWGGAIADDPDMLVYSAPYDPFSWAQNADHPEDGAGDVLQPSWDGDSFTALAPLGGQLIALKRTRVWRIYGSNPGEYVFSEQYGGGTPCFQTVAAHGTDLFMLGREGLMRYDGECVSPYRQSYARGVFERMNPAALSAACACVHRGVYYCALPLDGSPVNNAVLRYDTQEDTWLVREGVSVESFLSTEDALYFTSSATPGRVWLWQESEEGAAQPMRWVSPWLDLGMQSSLKGDVCLYLTSEGPEPVYLRVGLETEKRLRMKDVRLQGTRRIRFPGFGRRLRFVIESSPGVSFRLISGAEITLENEEDV